MGLRVGERVQCMSCRGLWVLVSAALAACSADNGPVRPPSSSADGESPGVEGDGSSSTSDPSNEIPGGRVAQPTMPPPGAAGSGAMPREMVDPDECSAGSETADVELGPADIVWVIDGSASMLDEIMAVQQNITNFANQISMAGIDHHVVMVANADVAAPTPLGADPEHYRFVLANVDSRNSLQVLLDTYSLYSDFMRPEAPLHFVVVTDDNSFLQHAQFKDQMEALAGKPFFFHSIASEDAPGPCIGACGLPLVCGAFAPGFEYYALSDLTGGQKISICTADWSQVFGPLQEAVIASAPLPCDYPIPPPPTGESLDPAKVNMEFIATDAMDPAVLPRAESEADCADNAAWFYDDPAAPTTLRLCPSACELAQGGGTVNIAFGCETVPLVLE